MVEGMPVEEALDLAQERIDDFRACAVANDALEDFQALQSCVEESNE